MSIRRRVLSESQGLPVFDVDAGIANVCKNNARIDKFEINYARHILHYIDTVALRAFKRELSTKAGFASIGRNTNGVQFSNDVMLDGERIYFNARGGGAGRCKAEMVINANYNRFYQSNEIKNSDFADGFSLERDSVEIEDDELLHLFLKENPRLEAARELTLDHNDNLLLRPRWHEVSDVLTLLPLQLKLIQQFIENQFDVNPNHPPRNSQIDGDDVSPEYLSRARVVPIFDWSNYSIRHLEVYWDFHCKDAIAVAKHYQQPMQQITTQMKTRYHHHTSETHRNAVSHSANLINNVRLSVYAKTPTRIRFEVVYYKKSLKSIFSKHLQNETEMRAIIDYMLDDATSRLNKFMGLLQRYSNPPVVDRAERLTQFLKHISIATGGEMSSRQEIALRGVFALMSHSGRIVLTRHQQPTYAPILDYLTSQKIVEHIKRSQGTQTRTYSFTPEYQWLLDGLRG